MKNSSSDGLVCSSPTLYPQALAARKRIQKELCEAVYTNYYERSIVSNLFRETETVPEDCLGTRITRHEHYYVPRKIHPPPEGAATRSLRLGSTARSSVKLPVP
jgi:hypothetical protein